MTEVTLYVMIDEEGDYEIAKDAGDLQAPAGMASRLVKVTVNVPTPVAVELEATLDGESSGGELKVA